MRTLFCFGFFVHDPKWFPLFRWLVRLDRANDHYIIFSESEAELYQAELGIAARRMHFVPLGDWRQMRSPVQFQPASEGDYYFAGGRSNRDYRPVIEAFRSLPVETRDRLLPHKPGGTAGNGSTAKCRCEVRRIHRRFR